MYCPGCGEKVQRGQANCPSCGARLVRKKNPLLWWHYWAIACGGLGLFLCVIIGIAAESGQEPALTTTPLAVVHPTEYNQPTATRIATSTRTPQPTRLPTRTPAWATTAGKATPAAVPLATNTPQPTSKPTARPTARPTVVPTVAPPPPPTAVPPLPTAVPTAVPPPPTAFPTAVPWVPTSGGGGGGGCCRYCDPAKSKPCGDACISLSKECHTPPGCACVKP